MTARSRALRWGPLPKHPLQITMRTPKEPAFKFELLPLHSPLLRQSLLVSFPPLIDMLKFSGYPYLIRGQPWKNRPKVDCPAAVAQHSKARYFTTTLEARTPSPRSSRHVRQRTLPNTKQSLRVEMTLEQACPPEYQRAQCAFKDSMIH